MNEELERRIAWQHAAYAWEAVVDSLNQGIDTDERTTERLTRAAIGLTRTAERLTPEPEGNDNTPPPTL